MCREERSRWEAGRIMGVETENEMVWTERKSDVVGRQKKTERGMGCDGGRKNETCF